jgi:hypothetical protein
MLVWRQVASPAARSFKIALDAVQDSHAALPRD